MNTKKSIIFFLLTLISSIVYSQSFNNKIQNPFGITDVGSYVIPALVDIDNDGDKDLFVGELYGSIYYFKNNGTSSIPYFVSSITNPFGITYSVSYITPTFVDIDNDGKQDLFFGDTYGNIYFSKNNGTASNPNFASSLLNPFGITDVGSNSAPTFVDIDNDGDKDLFVGEAYGSVYYFKNNGTASNPNFALSISNPFGITDVGSNVVPTFVDIDNDGDKDLFVGEAYGSVYYFKNNGTATNPNFASSITNPFGITDVGSNSALAFVDIDNDGDKDLFSGELNGSIYYFKNMSTSEINTNIKNLLFLYPNPTNGFIYCDFSSLNVRKITILDITGRVIIEKIVTNQFEYIDLSNYSNGIYVINIQTEDDILTRKIIKK